MIVKYDRLLDSLLEDNLGVVTSEEVTSIGVNRTAFADYVKRKRLERVSRGVYLHPDYFPNEMLFFQKRFPKAIFSHETSLSLHDMVDKEPLELTVSVSSNYNATSIKNAGARVHFVKPSFFELGMTELSTQEALRLKTYDKERTICDIVRKRNSIDVSVLNQAIKNYVRSKDKDLNKLSQYARILRIENRVREIMEVAL